MTSTTLIRSLLVTLVLVGTLITSLPAGAAGTKASRWYFWRQTTTTGYWQCVGFVNAPRQAAEQIAQVDTMGYLGAATVHVSAQSRGCSF